MSEEWSLVVPDGEGSAEWATTLRVAPPGASNWEEVSSEPWAHALARFGAEGWELVTATLPESAEMGSPEGRGLAKTVTSVRAQYTFKRPVE
ncbi:hypothetical protein ACFO3J_17870 [Streptomyces polygonati]|uniref:DUF4177 domain-containing protein n=1 Tax=Streptomyces polygonati TaxID=1617087 RepID=A0ABV8HQ96_9ACTN